MSSGTQHAMLEAATALLRQGRIIDRLSRLLTVAALALLVAASMQGAKQALATALALAVLAGLAQTYYAIRVGFDAALFGRLRAPAAMDLAALDAALVQLGLVPASSTGRPLEQRIAGAQRLLYKQGAAFVTQVVLLLCGAVAAYAS